MGNHIPLIEFIMAVFGRMIVLLLGALALFALFVTILCLLNLLNSDKIFQSIADHIKMRRIDKYWDKKDRKELTRNINLYYKRKERDPLKEIIIRLSETSIPKEQVNELVSNFVVDFELGLRDFDFKFSYLNASKNTLDKNIYKELSKQVNDDFIFLTSKMKKYIKKEEEFYIENTKIQAKEMKKEFDELN